VKQLYPVCTALLLLVASMTTPAQDMVAAGGAQFPTRLSTDAGPLLLAGTGTTRYRVIFTVNGAAFYVPEGTAPGAVLDADTPRHLEIEYFYEISAKDIIRASTTVLDRQLSKAERAEVKERLQRWHDSYKGVTEGDRYSMRYIPDQGTTLRYNGQVVATMEGADFARAYFGIWLARQKPLSESLRSDLLSRLEGR